MLSKPEKQELEKTFKAIDKNGDGHLSRQELVAGYTKLTGHKEIAEKEVEKLLKNVDTDKSGSIDYTGICSFYNVLLRILSCCIKFHESLV